MREIKFRGQSINDGEWIYGLFTREKIGNLICPCIAYEKECDSGDYIEFREIKGETLGQYTGLCDREKKEIYDGDILEIESAIGTIRLLEKFEVIWLKGLCSFQVKYIGTDKTDDLNTYTAKRSEVIGNRWDNPELLGG